MRDLIRRSHESAKSKKSHTRRAWQLFRALLERKIIEFIPQTADGAKLRVNADLQDDFSMDRTLSLYLIETLSLLDQDAPDYSIVLLTLVESILEDPEIILRKQLDSVKDEAMAEMKSRGRRVRTADRGTREARIPKAESRIHLLDLQCLCGAASVGGHGEYPAQIHRAGNVRTIPFLRRLRGNLRSAPCRRSPAAASLRRPQSHRAKRARSGEERGRAGNGALS